MKEHDWRLVIDRGGGLDTLIVETTDLEGLYRRIGQMVMSLDIEQVAVYRDDVEYRRYVLERSQETESE